MGWVENILILIAEFLGSVFLGVVVVSLTIKIIMCVCNFFSGSRKKKCLCSSCKNCDVYLELFSKDSLEEYVYKHCTLLDLKEIDRTRADVRECTLCEKRRH